MIESISLEQFRSYKNAEFEFNSGINIIVGPNASGKTNLLEALLVLAQGSSYRAGDIALVRFGDSWTRVVGHHDNHTRSVKIDTHNGKSAKTFVIDNHEYKQLRLERCLPAVLFEPNHLRLFVVGPEGRRDYLDDILEQTEIGFAATRRQYRRIVSQRNKLLKQNQGIKEAEIFPWNIRLSQLAGQIVRSRSRAVKDINNSLSQIYSELSNSNTEATAVYSNPWPVETYESNLVKKLESHLEEDRLRGFTGYGPHREDLTILINQHPAQAVASRGELRTIVLALKIIELQLLQASRGQPPLLLLDDVLSELDARRRRALIAHVAKCQTFITSSSADIADGRIYKNAHVLTLG